MAGKGDPNDPLPRRCPHGVHQPEAWACQRTICFATALSARSASYKIGVVYGNVILCHGAVRTECILLKIELEGLEAFFATALSARSASSSPRS